MKAPKNNKFFFWVGFGEQKKSSIKKGLVSPKWRFKELNGISWLKTKGQKKAGNPTHHESLKTKEGLLCFFGGIFSSLCSSIRSTYKLIFFLMIFCIPFSPPKIFEIFLMVEFFLVDVQHKAESVKVCFTSKAY